MSNTKKTFSSTCLVVFIKVIRREEGSTRDEYLNGHTLSTLSSK